MAYTTIVTGTAITSSWANADVRDQVVVPFASSAARSSAITSPVTGQLSTLTTNLSTEGIYLYTSAGKWQKDWSSEWGELGSASYASAQNTVSTIADLTGLTVTFTAVANRIYEITGRVYFEKATTADTVVFGVYDGSNVLQELVSGDKFAIGDLQCKTFYHRLTGLSAGSTTMKLRASTASGTFNVRSDAITGRLVVKDAGPNGAPA